MRALTRGERQATVGVAAGLFAVLCLLAVSLGSVLWVYDNLQAFRDTAYHRCLARIEYDRSNQAAREAQRRFWLAYIADEQDERRVESARRMVGALDDTLGRSVPADCSGYRP